MRSSKAYSQSISDARTTRSSLRGPALTRRAPRSSLAATRCGLGATTRLTETRNPSATARQIASLAFSVLKGLVVAGLLVAWAAHSAKANVYWTNSFGDPLFSIGSAPLEGGGGNPSYITELPDSPSGIAVYETYIYWANPNGTIGRAGLDGNDVKENFIPGAGPPIGHPNNVAVRGDYIYWSSTSAIGRAKLDGTDVTPNFIPSGDSLLGAFSVAVDENYIYVGEEAPNTQNPAYGVFTIGRANLDGTGLKPYFITLGGNVPAAIAVNGTHIYWANEVTGAIGRAKLDGTDVTESFIPAPASYSGVTVDENYIYWAAGSTIGRAKLDGTDISPSFITVNFPYNLPSASGVAVSPISACGLLGVEPIPILAALLWLRGRRRRKLA